MNNISINGISIGTGLPAFIIAELSCNHLNNFDIAVKTIHKMKEAGADCIKLQTAKADSITIDSNKPDFVIKGGTLWDNRTLYDLYSETVTPWEWHKPLKDLAESLGMEFISSPFDKEAVDFLAKLNVPAFKIASFEITDIPMIEHAASYGKPMIVSTGIANEEDIADAVDCCRKVGNNQIILLKCTSAYPTPMEEVNLKMIHEIRNKFNCHVGLSDHTLGNIVPLGAVALGAVVIEKHFILDRKMGGPDAEFSLEPHEFKEMVDHVRLLEKALGSGAIELSKSSLKNKDYCRSLYVVKDVKKGERFNEINVRSIRPGFGMKPKYLADVLGKKSTKDIEKGTPLKQDLITD